MELEAETRKRRIDLQLGQAGWPSGSRVLLEAYLPKITDSAKLSESVSQEKGWFVDYVLHDDSGDPVAIVEAKSSSRSALEGEQQACGYVRRIADSRSVTPFIFLANGDETWFLETPAGPPRRISGFFTPGDLERLAFQQRYRETLEGKAVAERVVNRSYQINAVKAVSERIEQGHRKFLLVMATGTGKTRVAVALVDLLMRCKWIERVLFLADRRELVKQALDAFKEHLPDVPRARLEAGEIDPTVRILAATYPGMMAAYQRLSPGYFDLIIADESHRSIYNRYGALFDHFSTTLIRSKLGSRRRRRISSITTPSICSNVRMASRPSTTATMKRSMTIT